MTLIFFTHCMLSLHIQCDCICCTGWEYSVEATLGGYGPVEKAYHLCRRRRLVRLRQLVKPSQAKVDSEAKVLFAPYCTLLFINGLVISEVKKLVKQVYRRRYESRRSSKPKLH